MEQLIKDVVSDLAKTIEPNIFCELIILLNSIIVSKKVALNHTISILNAENCLDQGQWYTLIRHLPEKLATETIEIRISLIFKMLKTPENSFSDQTIIDKNIEILHKAYELYVKTLLRIHIANNHFDNIRKSILNSIEKVIKNVEHEYFDAERLLNFLLTQLVLNNNLFHFDKKADLREMVNDYSISLKGELPKIVRDGLNFNPGNFEIKDLNFGLAEPDFSKTDLDKIKTHISFVVPYEIDEKPIELKPNETTHIYLTKINNLFEDPIFSMFDSAEMSLNGMPVTFFSDSIGNLTKSTRIDIVLNSFHPLDFEIVDDRFVPLDFTKEKAKRGGYYHPYKDLILELLWELREKKLFPIEIKNLDSNFISNYLVSFFGEKNERIHHAVYTITNFNSYFNAKNKFFDRLNANYFSDDVSEIRSFILDTEINSKKSFFDFSVKFIEITLKKAVEFGGLHKSFWTQGDGTGKPLPERSAQPIIHSIIRFLAEMKGIRISREIVASDGSLDFHFSYTKHDVLMNVCVELKNAHHGNLQHGITSQLPLYIRDVGVKEGIFLILWYKSENFNEPNKFQTISELETFLKRVSPKKKYRIRAIIIDCTPKDSPSIKTSEKRLRSL